MKRIVLLVIMLAVVGLVIAQTPKEDYEAWKRQAMGDYGRYRKQAIDDYQAFRKQANAEYAEWVKSAWATVGKKPPMEPPEEPKPPQPPVAPKEKPIPEAIPHEETSPMDEPKPVPEVPIPETTPTKDVVDVMYYGTTLKIHIPQGGGITLKAADGETLGAAWESLSDGSYDALLADCLNAKKELSIGDWGYITLLGNVAKSVSKGRNEAVLLQQWLLAQSGYQSRIGISKKGVLQIWMPFDVPVYNRPYIEDEGKMYFLVTENDDGDDELQVLSKDFPETSVSSLRAVGRPKLVYKACGKRTLRADRYPSVAVESEVNNNLIAYYNDYPKVAGSWDVYAGASLSDGAKKKLYPKMRQMLEGKTELQKAEMLLNWLQTAFQYKTDEEQFGGERSLFADETLYYPYCDCEDRSILLSVLVRDLLGLDVVLLHFPGHLATAVKFNTAVEGDWLDLEDGRYIVCDPTYIGAPVGVAMPECKEQDVRVVR